MLISKTVKVKWNSANKKWYENKGYKWTRVGDEFNVKIKDLSKGSNALVEVQCDYCGRIVLKKWYAYNKEHYKGDLLKDSCIKCRKFKNQEINKLKYGGLYYLQTEIKKQKTREYFQLNYGVDNYTQTQEYRDKINKRQIEKNKKYIIEKERCALIQLSNSDKVAIIDKEDIKLVHNRKWSLSKNNYVIAKTKKNKKYITIYLHRLVMNCPSKLLVDHINHNTLDNRKYNLRICTCKQNNQNHILFKTNKSGINGVCWNDINKKWEAWISIDNKSVYLGSYTNIIDAKKVREKADDKHFKEFQYKYKRK